MGEGGGFCYARLRPPPLRRRVSTACMVFYVEFRGIVFADRLSMLSSPPHPKPPCLPPTPPPAIRWYYRVLCVRLPCRSLSLKLRATVTDLSDAVRGRASIWSAEGLNGTDVDDDDLLERVGLLEEIPNDSICERGAYQAVTCCCTFDGLALGLDSARTP